MQDTITTMFCLCDDFLKANGCYDDKQCRVSTAQVMTTPLVAAAFFGGNCALARRFLVSHGSFLHDLSASRFCRRLHRRWIKTTQSAHGWRRYPNLVKGVVVERLNQVWVADLTYIRLPQGFAYLATILDAYSRKAIGWHVSRHLDARLVLVALEQALQARQPAPGFIHHSDQGVQYACGDYVAKLLAAGGQVSMAAKGCPRENAQAESFFRTLKVEEVYLQEYHNFAQAEAGLEYFIGAVYNQKRLHSALDYVPPTEYEENLLTTTGT